MAANPSLASRKFRITIVTSNGFIVDSNDQPSYEASVIRGFASVLGKEIENWSVCIVDLSSSSDFDLKIVPSFNEGIRFVAIRNGTVLKKNGTLLIGVKKIAVLRRKEFMSSLEDLEVLDHLSLSTLSLIIMRL